MDSINRKGVSMKYLISEVFEDTDPPRDMYILHGEGPSILKVLGFEEQPEDIVEFEVLLKGEDGRIFSLQGSNQS